MRQSGLQHTWQRPSKVARHGRKTGTCYLTERCDTSLNQPSDGLLKSTSKSDYESRKEEITKQLVEAAEFAGFFTLVDHGITVEEIESQFAISKRFFNLPSEFKSKTPHDTKTNNGWEYKVRRHPNIEIHPTLPSAMIGTTSPKYRNIRPKGVSLASTEFGMAKRQRCSRLSSKYRGLHGKMCHYL